MSRYRGEGPGYLQYKPILETYALAITPGNSASSSISPYPEDLRVCTGSYHEAGTNKLEILGIDPELIADPEGYAEKYYYNQDEDARGDDTASSSSPQADLAATPPKDDLVVMARRRIKYPPTKVLFGPSSMNNDASFGPNPHVHKQFLATAGETLSVYALEELPKAENEDQSQYVGHPVNPYIVKLRRAVKFPTDPRQISGSAPMTSFDWCNVDTTRIVTCSTNNSCKIWDWPTKREVARVVIHGGREVCDVAWQPGCTSTFVAGTGNGTVHLQDIRDMGKQLVLYQPPPSAGGPASADQKDIIDGQWSNAIGRLSFNPGNRNLVAALHLNDTSVRILDIRNPGFYVAELSGHVATVNGFAWRTFNPSTGPQSQSEKFGGPTLATVSDDCQVLLWNLDSVMVHADASAMLKGKDKVHQGTPVAGCVVPDPIESVAWGVDNDYLAISMGSHIRCMRI